MFQYIKEQPHAFASRVTQQAREITWTLRERSRPLCFLVRDPEEPVNSMCVFVVELHERLLRPWIVCDTSLVLPPSHARPWRKTLSVSNHPCQPRWRRRDRALLLKIEPH
jgi:hypothetical protein